MNLSERTWNTARWLTGSVSISVSSYSWPRRIPFKRCSLGIVGWSSRISWIFSRMMASPVSSHDGGVRTHTAFDNTTDRTVYVLSQVQSTASSSERPRIVHLDDVLMLRMWRKQRHTCAGCLIEAGKIDPVVTQVVYKIQYQVVSRLKSEGRRPLSE